MKVLVLGHKGMLGHMVHKYLSKKNDCEVFTTNLRWPTEEFQELVNEFWYSLEGDYIINCIGAIHQRTNNFDINTELPIWLDDTIDYNLSGCKVIHPGTDCEIDDDDYGNSKRKAFEYIVEKGCMTKIIKTSIVGTELNTKASLLEWFLNTNEDTINGYDKCYWNGNTTLQWAKICYDIMVAPDNYDVVSIPATECVSKYELLKIMNDVYGKDIKINKNSDVKINKCLKGNIEVPTIKEQLKELYLYTKEKR